MIGLGGLTGGGLSGGSSGSDGIVDSGLTGQAGITLTANKGLQTKDILALGLPAVLILGVVVVALRQSS